MARMHSAISSATSSGPMGKRLSSMCGSQPRLGISQQQLTAQQLRHAGEGVSTEAAPPRAQRGGRERGWGLEHTCR